MKCKKLFIAVVALLGLATQSCTDRLTDFTVISTKNVPIGNQPTDLVRGTTRVKGVDKKPIILSIPIGSPNLKEAIDKAIEQCPGAIALADGVVKSKFLYFFFYGQNSYIVEGTPLYPADYQPSNNQEGYNSQQGVSGYSQQNQNTRTTERPVMRITHEVTTEKNASELAKMYEVSVPDILKWNKLTSPVLTRGQKVVIYLDE